MTPIPTSRLLVGILLHLCVPAYLVACLGMALFGDAPAMWADVAALMLRTAIWFVPALLASLSVAAGVGSLIDRRRPMVADEAASSRAALLAARQTLAGLAHPRVDRALARLDASQWNHGDPRDRQIALDLAAAARTFAAAHRSADATGRPVIGDLAADSAERLVSASEALAAERRRLDEGDARTVAGYVAGKYGQGVE